MSAQSLSAAASAPGADPTGAAALPDGAAALLDGAAALPDGAAAAGPFLVVVDPQRIFADPSSEWASPFFAAAWERIEHFAHAFNARFPGRVIVTRWLPEGPRQTSWGDYFRAWPFADVPATDAVYQLTPAAARLAAATGARVVDTHRFGKWVPELKALVGSAPQLLVTGVATDCCVISTVLPAVDDGAYVTLVTDAVAHSSAENGAAALKVMELYAPMVRLVDSAALLSELGAAGSGAAPAHSPAAPAADPERAPASGGERATESTGE